MIQGFCFDIQNYIKLYMKPENAFQRIRHKLEASNLQSPEKLVLAQYLLCPSSRG
jgi:hypothetical protein